MKRRVALNTVGALILLVMGISCAPIPPTPKLEEYPGNAILLQVPFGAGGYSDFCARIVASIAEKEIGQPIVVVNKRGPRGEAGWAELAKLKPDGNHFGMIDLPFLFTSILYPEGKVTFKAEDFVPIINETLDPVTISVRPDSPWKDLKDLIGDAKKRPGQISTAVIGRLSESEIGYMMLAQAANIEMKVWPSLAGPAVTALLNKHVDILFSTGGTIYSFWSMGKIRMLTIMDKERSKFYPDVPTTMEFNIPTVISARSRGIVAPKGTPEASLKKFQDVFHKAMMKKEHVDKLESAGVPVKIMVGEEFVKYYWDNYNLVKKWVDHIRRK